MPTLLQALLVVLQNAPAEIDAFKSIYAAVKGSLTPTDIVTVDSALAQAIADDLAATQKADAALEAASKR